MARDPHESSHTMPSPSAAPELRTDGDRLLLNDEPVHTVGTGLAGLRRDAGIDALDPAAWRDYVARLAALQTPHVRLRLRFDPWAFCWEEPAPSCAPWAPVDGGYDLERFHPPFWDLLREIGRLCGEAGLLLEVILFDSSALDQTRPGLGWNRNPFSAHNGGPLAGRAAPAFYRISDLPDRSFAEERPTADWTVEQRLTGHLQRYVLCMLDTLEGLPDVTWELVRQIDGADPLRLGFAAYWLDFLRRHDPLDRLVTLSAQGPRLLNTAWRRFTGLDTMQFHLDGAAADPGTGLYEAVEALRPYGRPVLCGEACWPEADPRGARYERGALWQALVAGAHGAIDCRYGLQIRPIHDWVGVFARFAEETDFASLRPAPDLIVPPPGTKGRGALGPREAIAYLTAKQPAPAATVPVRLPAGTWTAAWIDPRTGQPAGPSLTLSPAYDSLPCPAFDEDLALRLKRVD